MENWGANTEFGVPGKVGDACGVRLQLAGLGRSVLRPYG